MKWLWTLGVLMVMGSFCHAREAGKSASVDIGESIYRRGELASGAPLLGARRAGSPGIVGADAACINCHRRSGLGSREGTLTIPPLTGEYLFRARGTGAQ
jgi:cytochrome c553